MALSGYCIATFCNLYTNVTHYQRLSQLETVYVPLAALSSDILHTFQKQTERYEDAFLAGEKDLAVQGNLMSGRLLDMLDRLRSQAAQTDLSASTREQIDALIRDYREYTRAAAQVYTRVATADFSLESQKKIRHLGQMQMALLHAFSTLDKHLAAQLTKEIENDKSRVLRNAFFVGVLFVVVLLAAALIIDRVASRLLVQPLARLQENVNRFSLSQPLPPPTGDIAPHDEIGRLAKAFWEMTEKLKKTMVSQRYVDNILRNISSGLVVTSPAGIIQTVNPRIVEIFGHHENELIGHPLDLLLARPKHGTSPAASPFPATLLASHPIYDHEILCLTKEQRTFPTHFSSSPMYNEQGVLQGIVCIFNDITELKNAEIKLRQLAHYDPLTEVGNRNLLFERLDAAVASASDDNQTFALLYIDLDRFKPINDTLGHDIGDLILKNVAKRLLHIVRADDTVARIGGDEFIIILNALHGVEDATKVAQKIVRDLATPFVIGDISQTLGASVGISLFPTNGTCAEELLTKADQAMYEAKAQGRNGYRVYRETAASHPPAEPYRPGEILVKSAPCIKLACQ